jgi:hypothetical protein
MRYRYPRRNPADLVEELDALAARVADLEAEGEFVDLYDKARPILNRHLGRHLGPSADWLNPTWRLGGDLYLFEGDDNDYTVLSRTPNEDPDEPDVIEEVEALRSLDALRRYFRARKNPVDVVDFPDELKDLVDGYKNEFVADVTGPWADYDVVVDQYVARIMRDLGDTPYESETASDDFIDRWEKGLVEAEVMVMLGAALESRGRGRAAHQAPVPARRNPRKTPPPPPPSHTFQLTADPYQQRLFGPEAFEQRPKKRAVEPMPVDERQVDLFAPPPPPKKNPYPRRRR